MDNTSMKPSLNKYINIDLIEELFSVLLNYSTIINGRIHINQIPELYGIAIRIQEHAIKT